MFDPYYITWGGVVIHLLLIAPLALFAWKHKDDEFDD